MVMEDLQHIIPDQVKRHFTDRKLQIILITSIAFLSVLSVTFIFLYSFKHVELASITGNGNEGGKIAALAVKDNTCFTPACLDAASWMISNMDTTVKPCDDFYAYACGGYEKRSEPPPESAYASVRLDMWQKNEEHLRILVEGTIERDYPSSAERKLKEFFSSCLHDYGRYKEGGFVLVDIIRGHLGGWYVFDPEGFASTFDLDRGIIVAQTEYLVDILFAIDVYPDSRTENSNIITIRSGGLGMYYTYYYREDKARLQDAYRDYINHIAHLLTWDGNATLNSDVIDQFVEDVYYQESSIAQGMQELRSSGGYWSSAVMTVAELQNNVTQIPWLPVLRGVFGNQVNTQTEIYVRQLPYFQLISNILSAEAQNKTRIMNNYIIWRVIDEYANHLSWDYKYAGFRFHEKYMGSELYLPTWEHCLGTIEYRLGPALAAQFLHKVVGQQGKEAVEQMVEHLRLTLDATIDAISWMDNETRTLAKEKIAHTNSIVGFPGEFFDTSYIDGLLSSLQINQSDGYFRNLLNINNFTKDMFRMEINMGRHYQMWRYLMSGGGFGVSPLFYWSFQTLIVPGGAMGEPQFYSGPSATHLSYGAIGALLAEQMANTINDRGKYVWYNSSYIYWWTQQTENNYSNCETCFENDVTSKDAGPFLVEGQNVTVPIHTYNVGAIISDIMGLETAYKAYKEFSQGQGLLPALNMTHDQAFFLSATQMRCSKWRPEDAYTHARAGYMPDNMMVNTMLRNMDDFGKAFNCPKDSPMNPTNKCHVF